MGRVFQENRPYGPPMRDAIASGDLNEMRRVQAYAREWLSSAETDLAEIRSVLGRLEAAIADLDAE